MQHRSRPHLRKEKAQHRASPREQGWNGKGTNSSGNENGRKPSIHAGFRPIPTMLWWDEEDRTTRGEPRECSVRGVCILKLSPKMPRWFSCHLDSRRGVRHRRFNGVRQRPTSTQCHSRESGNPGSSTPPSFAPPRPARRGGGPARGGAHCEPGQAPASADRLVTQCRSLTKCQ